MNESLVYLKEPQSGDLVDASLFEEVTDEHPRRWDIGRTPQMRRRCTSGKILLNLCQKWSRLPP